jgi:putative transposase
MPFKGPYTKLFCHLVWGTWDRQPFILPGYDARLHAMIQCKLREIECTPIATGGVEDHVHVLCQFPPALSISEIVKRIKGASSHFMNDELLGAQSFRWQATYGALTVGGITVPKVKAYVLNQKEHHASYALHKEWERVWIPDGIEAVEKITALSSPPTRTPMKKKL